MLFDFSLKTNIIEIGFDRKSSKDENRRLTGVDRHQKFDLFPESRRSNIADKDRDDVFELFDFPIGFRTFWLDHEVEGLLNRS